MATQLAQSFVLRDSTYAVGEPGPDDCIIVHISPNERSLKEGLRDGLLPKSGEVKIARFDDCKFALMHVETTYTMALSGTVSEPDEILLGALKFLYEAFCFYHGSIVSIKDSVQQDKKRFCSMMTRIWSNLLAYFRSAGDVVFSSFTYVPYFEFGKTNNRLFFMASQILDTAQRRDGVFGGCVIHKQSVLCSQLDPSFTLWSLALVQPSHSSNHVEETYRRIQRQGLRLRDQMLKNEKKLIRPCEHRLRTYNNCFVAREMVDFIVLSQGSTRAEAVEFGSKMLQHGVIRSIVNEPSFTDEPAKYFFFRIDDAASQGPLSGPLAGKRQAPLTLSWHGRDARTAQTARGIELPEGVFVLRVFVEPSSIESLRQHTPWRNRPNRFLSTESLMLSENDEGEDFRARNDSLSSTTHMLEQSIASREFPQDAQSETTFIDHLAALRLEGFQDFFVAQGLRSIAAVDARLASLTSLRALERFVSSYTGPDRDRFLVNLAHASRVVSRECDFPNGHAPACLYLHGVGDTAVALLLEWSRWNDQEFLSSLSDLLARDIARLDHTCAARIPPSAHACSITSTSSSEEAAPAPVEQYNMLSFDRCTAAISGWANRTLGKCDPWERLQPATDCDRAFVDAVSEMHDQFSFGGEGGPREDEDPVPVAEMVLHRPGAPPIYGCRLFSQEVYFQAGQYPGSERGAKLYDEGVSKAALQAKDMLQKNHNMNFL